MKFLEFLLNEETSDKRKKEWADATSKHRDKLKDSGLYEARLWIKPSTNAKLKRLKEKYQVSHVGEVIDKLVAKASDDSK